MKDIFYDDQDRLLFLETVGEMSERFEIDLFAYVLMGNHYHLLIKTNRANLSRSMQWLGVHVYTSIQPTAFSFRAFISRKVHWYDVFLD